MDIRRGVGEGHSCAVLFHRSDRGVQISPYVVPRVVPVSLSATKVNSEEAASLAIDIGNGTRIRIDESLNIRDRQLT